MKAPIFQKNDPIMTIQMLLEDCPADCAKVLTEDLKGIDKDMGNVIVALKEKGIEVNAENIFIESKRQDILLRYITVVNQIDMVKYQ